MLIFWDAKLALLAVPKTGTQAREHCLRARADIVLSHPPQLKHSGVRFFRQKIRPLIDPANEQGFKTIAVIRNPVEWLGSWYRYRQRPILKGRPNSTKDISFDDFIAAYLADDQPPFAQVGDQAGFAMNGAGKVIVDHLFAYDHIEKLDQFLSQKLGFEVKPERHNVSPQAELDLSSKMLLALQDHLADEIALYQDALRGKYLPKLR